MAAQVEVAFESDATLGEGPTWDASTSSLLWVDILGARVHRFRPDAGSDEAIELPQHVGAAKPRVNGGLVLNLRDGIGMREPDGTLRWLVYWQRAGLRGNDAAVDPAGRLWAGTVSSTPDDRQPQGWLARVEPDGRASVVLDGLSISNGIGWSPDTGLMYHVDSPTRRVDVLDFDLATGEVTDRRPWCELAEDVPGVPDGLCVDADGGVWVAINGAGRVHRYTERGELDEVIEVPAAQVTACAFGGDTLTDLYVTTARENLSGAEIAETPLAGSLFVLPGIGSGQPATRFNG